MLGTRIRNVREKMEEGLREGLCTLRGLANRLLCIPNHICTPTESATCGRALSQVWYRYLICCLDIPKYRRILENIAKDTNETEDERNMMVS